MTIDSLKSASDPLEIFAYLPMHKFLLFIKTFYNIDRWRENLNLKKMNLAKKSD